MAARVGCRASGHGRVAARGEMEGSGGKLVWAGIAKVMSKAGTEWIGECARGDIDAVTGSANASLFLKPCDQNANTYFPVCNERIAG